MIKTLLVFIIFIFNANLFAFKADTVKAKIAVLHKYGTEFNALKSRDRVKAGEMIRIFVQPVEESYVYVVYCDNNEASLLYNDKKVKESDPLMLPAKDDYYTFDDKSTKAKITVICSSYMISDINNLFTSSESIKLEKWNEFESRLLKSEKKKLGDETDKPFPIAGKVSSNKDFLDQLKVFVGNNMLIRQYELEIKK
jgi:hypothetical protein